MGMVGGVGVVGGGGGRGRGQESQFYTVFFM